MKKPLNKIMDDSTEPTEITEEIDENVRSIVVQPEIIVDISNLRRELLRLIMIKIDENWEFRQLSNKDKAGVDAQACIIFRSHLNQLTNYHIANPEIVNWLSIELSPYIWARWLNNKVSYRIFFDKSRYTRNELTKLWWAGVKLEDNPSMVKLVFNTQDGYEALRGRNLSLVPNALKSILVTLNTSIEDLGFEEYFPGQNPAKTLIEINGDVDEDDVNNKNTKNYNSLMLRNFVKLLNAKISKLSYEEYNLESLNNLSLEVLAYSIELFSQCRIDFSLFLDNNPEYKTLKFKSGKPLDNEISKLAAIPNDLNEWFLTLY